MFLRRREFLQGGAAALAGRGGLVLAADGKSAYSICHARTASAVELRAVAELQRFLREITGATLPVIADQGRLPEEAILVGSLALQQMQARLGREDFALKTAGRRLLIAGSAEAGALYGIYGFLDRLGCRWFTREVQRIPRLTTLRIPALDEVQRPAFEYREPYFSEAFDPDWVARNRANGALGLDRGKPADASVPLVRFHPFAHSFEALLPPQKYFATHPEYYSLIDGKRRAERSQLCLTNAEVLRLSTEAVLGWIGQHPEASVVSVSQNDWEGWCECEQCRRVEQEEGGAHCGPLLRFVNAIAGEVARRYPDKRLITLSYMYTEEPPGRVRPRPNVRIWLCPIGACEAHPYQQCPYNRYFMKNLEGWSRIAPGQIYIWHYATNFSHYPMPFPDFDELAADLPMYRRYGVAGLFMEGSYARGGGGENAELRAWLTARLLWNPRLDAAREIGDFMGAVYGNAAGPMREYFERLHKEVRQPPRGEGRPFWIYGMPPLFSDAWIRDVRDCFERAQKAAGDEAVWRRVLKARMPLEYVELLRAKTFEVRGDRYAPADLDGATRQFRAFLDKARQFGIRSIHEGVDLGVDEQEWAARMRPYRAVTLEDDTVRVVVTPELGGRAIRMTRKADGAEALRIASPAERAYPDTSGLALGAMPDRHSRAAHAVRWQVERAAARELVLAGEAPNGLRLRRTLRLDAGTLATATTAENAGREPLPCALESRFELNAGVMFPEGSLAFRNRDRGDVKRPLIQPGDPPTGIAMYSGAAMPDGQWTVESRSGGVKLLHRFQPGETDRCQVVWRARGDNRITVSAWTVERTLAPGEAMALGSSYALV